MRTLLAILVSTVAMHAYSQTIEADLDGNARALVASDMQPQPKALHPRRSVAQPRRLPAR